MRPALDARQRDAALAVLSAAELSRYETRPTDSFLAGRLLLRTLAGELLGMPPADVELVAVCPDCGGNHGRPLIVGSDLHVSLSHSPDAVVAAASWKARVGIDRSVDESWARLEAVLKADGRGLRVDPGMVEFDGELFAKVADAASVYRVFDVDLGDGIRATLAQQLTSLLSTHRNVPAS